MTRKLKTSKKELMKKSKGEIFLEAWIVTLNYLEHHPIQGRILFVGITINAALIALKFVAPELVLIIEQFKK